MKVKKIVVLNGNETYTFEVGKPTLSISDSIVRKLWKPNEDCFYVASLDNGDEVDIISDNILVLGRY